MPGSDVAKTPQTYRFALTDAEFRRAWLREYYRRPGWRSLRVLGGPAFVALGIAMANGPSVFMRGMGLVTVLFGIYYAFKPLLAASVLTRRRRASGREKVELSVTLHRSGVRIDDGRVRTELPWADIECAGEAPTYIWYQIAGGMRATIPLRVVEDVDALRALLGEHTDWRG